MNRKKIGIVLAAAVLAGGGVFWAARRKAAGHGAGAGVPGAGAAEAQSVTAFRVESATFTDVLDGLIGTVKGGAIELTYGGPEEQLIFVRVKLGQTVKKNDVLFELDHTRAGARKSQAEVALDRAQKLQAAGGSTAQDVKEARAAYDIALRDWQDTYVRAPKSGVVSEIKKQVGETVGRGEALGVVVSREDKLMLETGVIEGQLGRVTAGQKARIEIEALGNSTLEGEVIGVSREVTTTGRTGTVHISLPAKVQDSLRPGLSARCRIVVFDQAALMVPRQAYDGEKNGVYEIVGSSAVFRAAPLGHIAPDWYEVKEGVAPGALIVRDLILNPMTDGAAVSVAGEPETFQADKQ